MPEYKTLDKYIVSEKIKNQALVSDIFRGVKTENGKYDKFVLLKVFNKELKGFDSFLSNVISNVENINQLSNVTTGKIIDYGNDGKDSFLVYDYENGKFLVDILNESRNEGIPFNVDHVLSIVSGLLHSLEEAHSKNVYHGFIIPHSIMVSYEGKVKLYDYATGPYLSKLIEENDDYYKFFEDYIHPLVLNNEDKTYCDILSIGLLILKMLTGKCILENGEIPEDMEGLIENLEMGIGLDTEPIPDDIKSILKKSLLESERYSTISQFKEDVDELIKSEKYTPTTFNLAFFVHSMFRESSEKTMETLEVEKKLNYSGYISDNEMSQKLVVKKLNKSVIAVLAVIMVVILSIGYYFHSQEVKAKQEKLKLAEEANMAAKKALQVEKEMQEQIEKMKLERENKIKEIMKKADNEANKLIKKEMLKKKQEEEKLYSKRLMDLELKKRNAIEEKKKKLEYLKKLDENKKEKVVKTKKIEEIPIKPKEINENELKIANKTPLDKTKDQKPEVENTSNEKKNNVESVNVIKISLPQPFDWNLSIGDVILKLNKIDSISKIELNSNVKNKPVDFKNCYNSKDIENILSDSFTKGVLKFNTESGINGSPDILTINESDMTLLANSFKYKDINFQIIFHLVQNKNFTSKLMGKYLTVDNYIIPIFFNKIELKTTNRVAPSVRKKLESYLFSDFRKNFTIVAKVKNRKTTKFMLLDSVGNEFEYYFDIGNNFTGSSIKMIFAKK